MRTSATGEDLGLALLCLLNEMTAKALEPIYSLSIEPDLTFLFYCVEACGIVNFDSFACV
jgi:hypothetical protein